MTDPVLLGDVVSAGEVVGTIRESARSCLAVSLARHGYYLTPDELTEVVRELANNVAQSVLVIEVPPKLSPAEAPISDVLELRQAGEPEAWNSLDAAERMFAVRHGLVFEPIASIRAAMFAHRVDACPKCIALRPPPTCPECGRPVHASESDDEDRCADCIRSWGVRAPGDAPPLPNEKD